MLLALIFACATDDAASPAAPAPEAPSGLMPPTPPVPGTPAPGPAGTPPTDAMLPADGAPAAGDASAPPLPADQQGTVRVVGPEATKAIAEPIGKLMGGSGLNVTTVAADGGGAALEMLSSKAADVAIIARALKPSESQFTASTVGYDGVVLVVSPENKVGNLTAAQVVSLFTGKASSWKEVGGADVPVHLLVRGEGKTASRLFEEHFALSGKIAGSAKKVEKEKDVVAAVKADPGAIGFVSLAGLSNKEVEGVKRMSIDGVAPEPANLTNQTYGLVRPLNAVTLGPATGPAKAFVDFCRSEGGQRVITEKYAGVSAR